MTAIVMSDEAKLVQRWEEDIYLSERYRERFSDIKSWPKYRNYYRCRWDEKTKRPVNRIFSYIRSLIPRTYFRAPYVTVTATRPEYSLLSRVVEAIDNNLIQECNLKYTLKSAIRQSSLCGISPIKIGFDSEFGYVPDQALDDDGSTVTQFDKSKKKPSRVEYRSTVKPGTPWALPVEPEAVITPYGISDPTALPWIAHEFYRSLEDVQADQKYTNVKDLKGGFYVPSWKKSQRFRKEQYQQANLCKLHEIRDYRTGNLLVICEGKLLLEVEDELQIEGLPWEFLIFNEDDDFIWGVPDARALLPQQFELNEIRTQASILRRFEILKFLYKKGTIQKEDLTALFSDNFLEDTGIGIPVEDESIQAAVMELTPKDLTAPLSREKAETSNDMRETIGFGPNQFGEFTPYHNKSAREAEYVKQGSDIRTDERRDIVADVMLNIIRKFNQIIFKKWTSERVAEIVGPDGRKAWVKFSGKEIEGEYLLKVDPDAGVPVTQRLRLEHTSKLFEVLREDPLIDQVLLRKQLLRQYTWLDPTLPLIVKDPNAAMQMGVPPQEDMIGSPEEPVSLDQLRQQYAKGGNGAATRLPM